MSDIPLTDTPIYASMRDPRYVHIDLTRPVPVRAIVATEYGMTEDEVTRIGTEPITAEDITRLATRSHPVTRPSWWYRFLDWLAQ